MLTRASVFYFMLLSAPALRAEDASSPVPASHGDTSISRFEVGGQLADIRTGCIGQSGCLLPSFGLGLGTTLNLNQHFAIDANANVTPKSSIGQTNLYGGHVSEFLVGVRAEVRAKHYGYFLEAQPGVFTWSHVSTGVVYPSPTTFGFTYSQRHSFVSAVGAGLEYSPGRSLHVRVEVSDLVKRYSSALWQNNLQPSAGVYLALGKPIAWKPPQYEPSANHPFFNKANLSLIIGSVMGMTADGITTQRFIANGRREGNPFARPLIKYGWSGESAAIGLEIAAETLGMYGLHRIRQHWIERAIPIALATTHGVFAYNNANSENR